MADYTLFVISSDGLVIRERSERSATHSGLNSRSAATDLFGPIRQVYAQVARRAAPLADDTTDILAQMHQRFRYILVDEYQDTNVSQYLRELFRGQLAKEMVHQGVTKVKRNTQDMITDLESGRPL